MFIAIVPAYNESKRIANVVNSLMPHVDEVVVIDDGPEDDTAEKADEAGARVLIHRINLGQGAALETGHEYSRARGAAGVLHFDGDGQFEVSDIAQARKLLSEENVDIVLGSRFLENSSDIPWFKKNVLLPTARCINYLFTRVKLTDAHNGFRVLGPRALKEIKITHDGMAHATEIVELVSQRGLRYREIPVKVVYHEYGQRMSGGFTIIKDLIIGKFIN
jgi:glycosyltransferase involved in cell wall biosynthesis